MKVLVTGAGGFAGQYLLEELSGRGHDVTGVDRTGNFDTTQIKSMQVDLLDPTATRTALEKVRPDAIMHLAGWSHVGQSWHKPGDVYRINTVASIELYQAFGEIAGEKGRFIYISSADVYSPTDSRELPLDEQSATCVDSPYSASKLAAEQGLRLLALEGKPRLTVVRPFNHIGPRQKPDFALPTFARQVVFAGKGKLDVFHHGNIAPCRDFTDVRDMVRAYRMILETATPHDLYVAASGKSVSMKDLIETLMDLAGTHPVMKVDPSRFRPADTPDLRGNSRRLFEDVGWKPEIPLEQTLRDILDEARSSTDI